jgi:hypothetical protein
MPGQKVGDRTLLVHADEVRGPDAPGIALPGVRRMQRRIPGPSRSQLSPNRLNAMRGHGSIANQMTGKGAPQ